MSSADEFLFQARRFRVVRVHEQTEGGESLPRDVVRHPGSVVVLPIWEDGRVCLIRNYRVAVGDWLVELPAGTLEEGEPPLDSAIRELEEETGYKAEKVDELISFYAAPGILDEHMHMFLATGLSEGEVAREPGERIENLVVTLDEALEMVRDNTIRDAKTIVSLLYYELFVRRGGRK